MNDSTTIPEPTDFSHQEASEVASAAPCSQPCDCWEDTNTRLEEKGFRLSPLLSSLSFTLGVVRHLPLVRADGSKLKRSDPQSISISHCPWCGQKYPENKALSDSHEN